MTPPIVGQIIELDPDQVDATDRLLPLDPTWVDAIGLLMKTDGQLTPIEVCRIPGHSTYKLVVGGHRHAGAAKYGLKLRAEVVTNGALQRRLREASENVNRRHLSPIDRAKAVAELVAVQKAAAGLSLDADGRAASANARWRDRIDDEAKDATDTMSVAYGWADNVGERIGLTGRTIRRDLELLRGIPASIVDVLRRKDPGSFGEECSVTAVGNPCPVKGCTRHAKPKQLMCWPHWRRVPKALNHAVFDTCRNMLTDPAPYCEARDVAIAAVEAKEEQERLA